jgi:endonuclease YncB( thermonuclease family)
MHPRHLRSSRYAVLALAAALVLGACTDRGVLAPDRGTASAVQVSSGETAYAGRNVDYVNDGDGVKVFPSILNARDVRMIGIDAPEMGGDTQEPWATASRDFLRSLLPRRTAVTVYTGAEPTDVYGRILGRVVRDADLLDANREQLRMGHAVTYVIWPNQAQFESNRSAQIEAQQNGRGIWNPASPMTELPFVYRLRQSGKTPSIPVGDWYTRYYVDGADWEQVHVNNRIFFWNATDAASGGYTECPRTSAGEYASYCFASGS